MDETPTGGSAPEEKPVEVAPVAGPPTVGNPPAGSLTKQRNWTLIALIAVSCVALLLLGSTITLAVVGDFGGRKAGLRFERPGGPDVGPMQGPDGGRLPVPGRRFRQLENRDGESEQAEPLEKQPPDTQPKSTAPESRAVPPLEQAS